MKVIERDSRYSFLRNRVVLSRRLSVGINIRVVNSRRIRRISISDSSNLLARRASPNKSRKNTRYLAFHLGSARLARSSSSRSLYDEETELRLHDGWTLVHRRDIYLREKRGESTRARAGLMPA